MTPRNSGRTDRIMKTAEEVFTGVQSRAEEIANDAERVIEVMDVGDEVRQGDVYLTMIGKVPAGAVLVKSPGVQLAPGTTQGSRHCLRSLDRVRLWEVKDAGPLDGPIIEVSVGCVIDHPEHGNRSLPAGVYAVTYQRAFAAELRRVAD